ncbi:MULTISPECIES: hypothetical protein [unclassified Marinobacter]|uniref:hypothetical protein n=1 Tax=unclassified Marinobacter TaxID=83889 RepID=UPI0018F22006|nr:MULTISPECIES: hypothetical protein [unclassified Marinobacter]
MSDLKGFLLTEGESSNKLPSQSGLALSVRNQLTNLSISGFSTSKKEDFSSEVAKIATSEEVLNELSDSIGKPGDNESEEQFVERAKSTLANILRRKLKS